jgi:hypothetical protein
LCKASIATSPNDHRRILFYDEAKKRRTIHIGKCSKAHAEKVKRRVESLLVAKVLGNPIDQDDAVRLAGDGKLLPSRFAAVGLLPGEEL